MTPSNSTVSVPKPRKSQPRFPCTSAAFNFFPATFGRPVDSQSNSSTPQTEPDDDACELHSSAFWELRRSIAEGGEGFVRRMQDWESSRAHSSKRAYTAEHHRGRAATMDTSDDCALDDYVDDEDDDIQIYAGEASCVGLATEPPWNSPPRKRARSLGRMDLDDEPLPPHVSPSTVSSPFISDDDIRGSLRHNPIKHARKEDKTPSLSYTVFSSSNSSVASLSLPSPDNAPALHPTPATAAPSVPFTFTSPFPIPSSPESSPRRHVPMSATREEKAIAALSLALANGAGGLSDFAAARASDAHAAGMNGDQAGELWH
ncbi:hypothetical protein DENSPDRAFT_833385 [Dentipellis sp. KUC8613]|nr:hypothetical protein DENSPDRAFT_833385 [Dentipellis sp. KUC8613]